VKSGLNIPFSSALRGVAASALIVFLVLASTSVPFVHAQSPIVATVGVGRHPQDLAYDSGRGEVFVANGDSNTISVISDASNTLVKNISLPGISQGGLGGIAYDPAKGEVFAAYYTGWPLATHGVLSVISDSSNTVVANISLGSLPQTTGFQLAYDSGKGEMFVSVSVNNSVSVVSDATNSVVATVKVGNAPMGLAYDSAKNEIFAVDYGPPFNTISVISDTSNRVVANVTIAQVNPESEYAAYDPAKGEVFVTNVAGSGVIVVSDSSNSVVADIPGVYGEVGIAYDSGKSEMFVPASNYVYVLSDQTNSIVGKISVWNNQKIAGADFATYDPAKGEVFVSDELNNKVIVISDSAAIPSTSTTSASSIPATSTVSATATPTTSQTPSVPEFPYQLAAAVAFTVIMLLSFLLIRSHAGPKGRTSQTVLSSTPL